MAKLPRIDTNAISLIPAGARDELPGRGRTIAHRLLDREPMLRLTFAYVGTLATLCILDLLWLGVAAKAFYQSQIGSLLLDRPQWGAAVLFYVLFAAGVVIFVVAPALDAGSWRRALLHGALFGFVAYAAYDLTNLATLKGWTIAVTIVDLLWGAVFTGLAATAGFALARLAGGPP
jgi:uncharacterized membrane protein